MRDDLQLDAEVLDRARISRDPRFDGKFFIAVTSTGIYCRPICPSRTSKPINVRYYSTAAAAAEAGFRPCLRCRPEAAPGTPAWLGTCAVVNRALRMINEGALDEGSVESLAARLGVSSRHLHRLFMRHFGAAPITVAKTRRLHFAKRLLDETHLPITQIALASGFGSVRRFNDVFRSTYRRTPRELRERGRTSKLVANAGEVMLTLPYRPPFDWSHMMRFMGASAIEGVEHVTDRQYARTLVTSSGHALVRVQPQRNAYALELRISGGEAAELVQIASSARRVFDLTADSSVIDAALRVHPMLAALVDSRPGLRIPGVWDPFECAVRCLLSQGELPDRARLLLCQLVDIAGERIEEAEVNLSRTFPTAVAVASADLDSLETSKWKRQSLLRLAQTVLENRCSPADSEAVMYAFESIPEVSHESLQTMALLALSEPDAFPIDRSMLHGASLSLGASISAQALSRRANDWRPWRGYAAVHLWAGSIDTAGRCTEESNYRFAVSTFIQSA